MIDLPKCDPGERAHLDDASLHIDASPQNPLWRMTHARMIEFVREPEALFWVFIFPVLLALALGIAFRSQPPEKARVAVEMPGPAAERALAVLKASPDLAVSALTDEEVTARLRSGRIDVAVIPDGAGYVFRYDATRPQSRTARLTAADALERGLGRQDVAVIRDRTKVELGARYIDFLIPGLLSMNLMGSGMWGIGYNVVNARTRKLLKRLVVTPMRRSHFLLSFMFSRLGFLALEMFAVIGFARLVFGVTIHGSVAAFAFIILLGTQAFAGLGLLVAARTNSVEGVSGWINFVMMPMWLLSGTFFSYERFPAITHPFIRCLPLTALNDALRAVMNDGTPLANSWFELSVLAAWGLVSFVVALKIFKWQ